MAAHLVLARHGSIGPSYRGRYLGASDICLDVEGKRQSKALAEVLGSRRVGRVICSPQQRTLETAQAIGEVAGLEFMVDPDLREVDFGRWEGKTFQEIQECDPKHVERWARLDRDFAFPDGERMRDFLDRVHRAADRIARDPTERVLAVTHGGVIRAVICHLLGLEPRSYLLFEISPASVSTVRLFDGKGVLAELNNCSHLERC